MRKQMDYDNTNKGVLFPNKRKNSEKSPDYTGNININGKVFNLSGWSRQGKNGKFLSLSISEWKKEKQTEHEGDVIF